MCGIAGIHRLRGDGAADAGVVRRMLARMERRGPDDAGLAVHDAVTLGHRRLAILDLSPAGRQPMTSASGRTTVVFNGEIYNHAELRDELGLHRDELRSSTDTEILLHAWERWGMAALDRMAGQWAFGLYEHQHRRLWLVRDRFGEKPLFVARTAGALAFASSLQALVQVPWLAARIDRAALVEYLTMRYVVAPRTIVAGCEKVPPGCCLAVTADGITQHRWYEPARASRGGRARDREELVEEFDGLLRRAVRRCLVADVPAALLLSDGIDSNSIHAALDGREVESFTYRTVPERPGLVRAQGEAHDEPARWDVRVTPRERIAGIERALSSLTEPVGDGAALATWLVIAGARERAEVFLCGHGGDEILGGYRLSQDRFRLAMLHRCAWLPSALLRRIVDSKVNGGESAAERQRAVRLASPAMVPAAARYLIQHPLPLGDVRTLLGDGDGAPAEPYLVTVDRLYAECDAEASDLDRIQQVMIRSFLSENILSFGDSVAMDSSAELRMPFLDRDLVAFALALAPKDRVSRWPGRANTKRILRWWAQGSVPEDVVSRRKRGFAFGNLRELLDRDDARLRERLRDWPLLRELVPGLAGWMTQPVEFFRGRREKTLWSLLALGHWAEAGGIAA